jgi:uncharacterized lipoprotein
MKPGKLVAGAAFAILFAGCAVEHDSGRQQTGLAQSDVSRYVAAMSEQPGQLALKHQCGTNVPGLVSRASRGTLFQRLIRAVLT